MDWTYLQNTGMFLGNLAIALLLGLLTSVAWELPLAKIQKLVIGSFVSQMSKKPFPKWTLAILIPLIGLVLALIANFLSHLRPDPNADYCTIVTWDPACYTQ